ncbi:hypothetical protein GW17_00058734 [Ensete ventricosum]|nr:hypothetical protein GW17_00058734 [Ensete ventricosum]
MTMNPKKGADDSAIAKFDNPIKSNYHAPARSNSCEGHRSLPDVKETTVLSTARPGEGTGGGGGARGRSIGGNGSSSQEGGGNHGSEENRKGFAF